MRKKIGVLAALRIQCPYYHVRHSISMAMRRGDLWLSFVQHHRAEKPERQAKQKGADELANAINLFLKEGGIDWRVCHPTPLYSDRPDRPERPEQPPPEAEQATVDIEITTSGPVTVKVNGTVVVGPGVG